MVMVLGFGGVAGLVGNVDWAGLGVRVQSHMSSVASPGHLPDCKLRVERQDGWASSMLGR